MRSTKARSAALQHFLHSHPTTIPAFVLLLGVVFFSIAVGHRFLHPFNLSLIIQQVTIIGILGVAQTIIILTAGIDLSVGAHGARSVVMGRLAVDIGLPDIWRFCRDRRGRALRPDQRLADLAFPHAALHRDARDLEYFFSLNLWYSQRETIRAQDIEPGDAAVGTTFDLGERLTYGSVFMPGGLFCVCATTARGRHFHATGDEPDRHGSPASAPAGADLGLCRGRLFCGSPAGRSRSHRLGQPQGGGDRQSRQHHRRGDRRDQPVWRPRLLIGTLIGALIVGVFRNGLALSGVNVLWQEFAVGLLIIVAVAIDQWLRKLSYEERRPRSRCCRPMGWSSAMEG